MCVVILAMYFGTNFKDGGNNSLEEAWLWRLNEKPLATDIKSTITASINILILNFKPAYLN